MGVQPLSADSDEPRAGASAQTLTKADRGDTPDDIGEQAEEDAVEEDADDEEEMSTPADMFVGKLISERIAYEENGAWLNLVCGLGVLG